MIKFETAEVDQAVSLLSQMGIRYRRLGSAFLVDNLSTYNQLIIEYLCKSTYPCISQYDKSVWEGYLDAEVVL